MKSSIVQAVATSSDMLFAKKFNELESLGPLEASLGQGPLPLLDASRRMVISWSAKSACTHVVIWYLNRLGLLDQALRHHAWVHRYREEVLYRSEMYRDARDQLQREGASKWTYLKVVRDPVKRCVSSYRHALKHGYEDEKMSQALGCEIDHKIGYSYESFLEYLGQTDLNQCNFHHRVQEHSLDTIPFGRTWLIHVDEQDLAGTLAQIDRIQGCAPLAEHGDSAAAIASAAHRHAGDGKDDSSDTLDQWRKPLSVANVQQWPKHALLSASPATELARRIYRADYHMLSELRQRAECL